MTPFIAIACIIVGTICLLIGVFAAYTRRFGAQLVKDAPTNADPISVLIPAHNEEHCIAACVGAVLNQRGVNLKEVIVILDRCTDGTAAALVPLQADPRLRVMSLSACPSDWAGKVHALHYGSMQATGDWLVFIDCDVVVGPDLLRRARGSIGDNTLLSLIMDFRSSGIWDMLMIPLLGIAVNAHRPLRLVHDRRSKVAAASGQFMMFPTHRYRALGGHAAVRGELLEDLALAERVKHHGEGVMLAFTNGGAQVEMYSDWSSFHRGWRRILVEMYHRRPAWMVLAAIPYLLLGSLAVVTFFGLFSESLVLWSALALLGSGLGMAALWRAVGLPLRASLLWPLSALGTGGLLLCGAIDLLTHATVRWGGRSYTLRPDPYLLWTPAPPQTSPAKRHAEMR